MNGTETSTSRNFDSFRQYNKAQGDNFSNSHLKNVYEDPKVNISLNSNYPFYPSDGYNSFDKNHSSQTNRHIYQNNNVTEQKVIPRKNEILPSKPMNGYDTQEIKDIHSLKNSSLPYHNSFHPNASLDYTHSPSLNNYHPDSNNIGHNRSMKYDGDNTSGQHVGYTNNLHNNDTNNPRSYSEMSSYQNYNDEIFLNEKFPSIVNHKSTISPYENPPRPRSRSPKEAFENGEYWKGQARPGSAIAKKWQSHKLQIEDPNRMHPLKYAHNVMHTAAGGGMGSQLSPREAANLNKSFSSGSKANVVQSDYW